MKKLIIMCGLLVTLVGTSFAVEDGKGTNHVKNLKVLSEGVIDLGGDQIDNWNDVAEYVGSEVGTVIYIDNGKTNEYTENGSILRPFKTLESAFAALPEITTNNASDKYIYKIAPGTYNGFTAPQYQYQTFIGENVIITNDITIIGDSVLHSLSYPAQLSVIFANSAQSRFRNNDSKTFDIQGNIVFYRKDGETGTSDMNALLQLSSMSLEGIHVPTNDVGGCFGQTFINANNCDIEDGYIWQEKLSTPGINLEIADSIVKSTICGYVNIYNLQDCRLGNVDYKATPSGASPADAGRVQGIASGSYPGIADCRFGGSTYVFGTTLSSTGTPVRIDNVSYSRISSKTPTMDKTGWYFWEATDGINNSSDVEGDTLTDALNNINSGLVNTNSDLDVHSVTSKVVEISETLVYKPASIQSVDTNTTIQVSSVLIKIDSVGGDISIDAGTTQIDTASAGEGQVITVMGTSDANRVELHNGDGLKLDNEISFTIGLADIIQFLFDGSTWVEMFRKDI